MENKFPFLTQEIVNQVISEQLKICWNNFGQGDSSAIFDQNQVSSSRVCAICSQIELDSSASSFSGEQLLIYLKTAKMQNSDEYYFSYLNNQNYDSLHIRTSQLNGGERYYITMSNLVPSYGSVAASYVPFDWIKTPDSVYHLFLIPESELFELAKQCDQIIG